MRVEQRAEERVVDSAGVKAKVKSAQQNRSFGINLD